MNKKFKNILILVIGIIIGSTICVIGSNVITANQVGINSSKTDKTNIQDAIDELYTKANKIAINIKSKVPGATVVTENLPTGTTGVKAIVYMDPTNLSNSCTASNSVSTTGTKTGCMKWYVYAEYDGSYAMILDHNTTVLIHLTPVLSNALELIKSSLDDLVNTNGWVVTPRLISATEIAIITNNATWKVESGESIIFDSNCINETCQLGQNMYGWLFDRTNDQNPGRVLSCKVYGCNNENSNGGGYWTSTFIDFSIYNINDGLIYKYGYGVDRKGQLIKSSGASPYEFGFRPVITISK